MGCVCGMMRRGFLFRVLELREPEEEEEGEEEGGSSLARRIRSRQTYGSLSEAEGYIVHSIECII